MTRPFHSFCIVADDLSGAADCAATFARTGLPVPVYLGAVQEDAERLAIDLDSRSMDRAAAAATTALVFDTIARSSVAHELVYKKIDSTLRGHIGAELDAALCAGPQFAAAVVAPSFPEQGRTIASGKLLVQGRPAEDSRQSDLVNMLEAAGLRPVLFGQQTENPTHLTRGIETALEGGARTIVVDAADQGDLARLAAALCATGAHRLLVAGSAGLARALAAHFEPKAVPAEQKARVSPRAGPVMTLVGSFSKASAAQVEQVERSGEAQVVRLDAGQWLKEKHSALRQKALNTASESLRSGRHVLFAIGGELAQPFSRSLVQAMARVTAPLVQLAAVCVLTGGDTARAMLTELGVSRLDVCGEFEPGISIGRTASDGFPEFVLKAGGFGDALALQRIIRHFRQQRRQYFAREPAPS
jgi:uncharacterized protein YgbK (DUF1537 family)